MKKIFCLICLLLPLFTAAPALAAGIPLYLNGQAISCDVPPQIESNRVLVPLRAVGESLGANVNYSTEQKKVSINLGADNIILYLNSAEATINGTACQLDVPARLINDRTMIPLRFVGESLSLTVNWVGGSNPAVYLVKESSVSLSDGYAPYDTASFAAELLMEINLVRANNGKAALTSVAALNSMAAAHSKDMAQNAFFSHDSPLNGSTTKRAAAFGLPPVRENLARGYADAKTLLDAWLNSQEHRANILAADAAFIGVGVYQAGGYNDSLYATVVMLDGPGFLSGASNQKSTYGSFTATGYAQKGADITLFHLKDGDQSLYTSRVTYRLNPLADGSFSQKIELASRGTYLLSLGGSNIKITY